VSPAGGNFDEPVTQSTLKVVGAFHGLSRERSDARRYPAIDPLDSWSKYPSVAGEDDLAVARHILRQGNEVNQMMKVVGEEGTALDDFVVYLKEEFLDAVYLQQDAFHEVDAATSADRQKYVFGRLAKLLRTKMAFKDKESARRFFQQLTQLVKDWNRAAMEVPEFKSIEQRMDHMLAEVADYA
jgi:V/A-type H+-transporting ATPase subunit A